MFSYYGSKSQIVHLYPVPKHDVIVEPFAGSARYALKYFEKNILLIDKNPVITGIWEYLKSASGKDILSLPETSAGVDLRKFNLTDPERHLIYFCSTGGGAGSTGFKVRQGTFNGWHNAKKRIAKSLFKIRHWQIKNGDFKESSDIQATWFIDPPYFNGGHKYTPGNKQLDFNFLRTWANSRKGQVIVCENSSADWLPFITLKKIKGVSNNWTTEVFWTNQPIEKQVELF